MRPRQIVVTTSVAFALAFGSIATGVVISDALAQDAVEQATPGTYDRADFYEEAPTATARTLSATRASSLSSVQVTAEMKYFTQYESHANYRQGFSYGDGYNALGYYQFDRRYSLISFMTAVYNHNPSKYAMLKSVIDQGSKVSSSSVSMYDSKTGKLTKLGQQVQNAWYAAYDADPAEFSALQDSYAYNSYYVPTERWLAAQGIDISDRADCVKGMVWGLSNMWGTGGVRNLLLGANLSNDMTDREFVTALSRQMTDNISKYSSQTQYYAGWKNRYKNELADCLAFIAEDEAAAVEDEKPQEKPNTPSTEQPGGGSGTPSTKPENGSASDSTETPKPDDNATPDSDSDTPGADTPGTVQDDNTEKPGGTTTPEESEEDVTEDEVKDPEESEEDEATDPTLSKPNRVPPSNAVGGVTNGSTSNGSEEDGSEPAEDEKGEASTPVKEEANGNTSAGSTTSDNASSSDAKKDSATSDAENTGSKQDNGSAGSSTTSNAKGKTADTKSKSASDATRAATKTASEKSSGAMPQTSDLVMLAGFASASAACFGATFVYAGKRGLKKAASDEDADGANE